MPLRSRGTHAVRDDSGTGPGRHLKGADETRSRTLAVRDRHRPPLPEGVAVDVTDEKQHLATHAGRAYPVTGARAWTYDEVARLLSGELARPIRYEQVGFLRYRAELRAQGCTRTNVRVQLLINAVARRGRAGTTTDVFARLIGRDPIALPDSIHHLRDA